jgi:hypothetical protein
MTREDPPLRIRLPEGLKTQIQALAVVNRRSMNAEIVSRLEKSLLDEPTTDGPIDLVQVVKDTLEDHEERLAKLDKRLSEVEERLK